MSSGAPFLFNTDFREDRRAKGPSEAQISDIRTTAYAQGHEEGYALARAEMDAQLTSVATQLLDQANQLLVNEDERAQLLEAEAASLAVTFAKRLSGAALAHKPLAEIEAAARQCMVHARSAPHLAVRVAETMVEQVDKLFARIGREIGYAGKVIVLGEPDMQPAEARMEWADGGMVIDETAREAALDAAVSRAMGTPSRQMTES